MKQKIKSEHTQQLIIAKASGLFYRKGFQATGIPEIMQTTQLSKGAFYHHFKNKNEVCLAVIAQSLQQRINDSMIRPLLNNDENTIGILKDVFTSRLRSFNRSEKQSGCPVNNLINEIGDKEINCQSALRQIIEEWKAALTTLIEKGKQKGEISAGVNSTASATFLISAFEGIRGIRKLYNDDRILEDYLTAVQNYIEQLKS